MNNNLLHSRIPTLLGVAVIILGTAAGIYLTLQNQTLSTKASVDLIPKNIRVTNIEDTSATISWTTDVKTTGFVTFKESGDNQQTALDDRDSVKPSERVLHHVSLKNLIPQTTYQFKIISGKLTSEPEQFTTAPVAISQNGFKPIIGSVLDGDRFLDGGLIYLEIPGAVTQSGVVKNFGSFLIPLSKLRSINLTKIFSADQDLESKIAVLAEDGRTAKASFILNQTGGLIGSLRIGEDLRLAQTVSSPSAITTFDLNQDGEVNAADHSIIINNFGPLREASKSPKTPQADLNSDGVVDQEDANLISQEMAKLGNQ